MSKFGITIGIISGMVLFQGMNSPSTEQRPWTSMVSDSSRTPPPLTPEQSLQTFRIPDGYRMELVASEPMITEPVAIAWDGDARMYVAQMETYTQDADGTGTKQNKSRVLLLEDTDGDGRMDKRSVFIKDLMLPRMLLCVDHELLVNETDTYDIYSYEDRDGDGVADVKKPVYVPGKKAPGNLEHQRSGLDWNVDNYIYQTVDPVRFRYTGGVLRADSLPSGSNGQWGLTHDDYGRLFYSRAGGENAGAGFQINPKYGRLDFPDDYDEATFSPVYPLIATPDVQGGPIRLRPDSTLNHFTAGNGQSIFRGDRLPEDLRGDYLINEPVARIIRRAKVIDQHGKVHLENAYDKKEFIASTDFYFRPVNTYTGPDGLLYIVDMSRGIIQESNWTRKGSFLRGKVDYYGLATINQRGRIWRLVHEDYKPGPKPKMLDVPAVELIQYLQHPNGWWRDNAQKQMVVLQDHKVVAPLKKIVTGKASFSALGRLHALWTLEGLASVDKSLLKVALKDSDAQVRRAAITISEAYLDQGDADMIAAVAALKSDPSYDVRVQLLLSLGVNPDPTAKKVTMALMDHNADKPIFPGALESLKQNYEAKRYGSKLSNFSSNDRRFILSGIGIYGSFCAPCHGSDGSGLASKAAPSLRGASLLNDEKDAAIRVLLHGLQGPVEGQTYSSQMPAMGDNSDEWIASVLSYIRFEFVGEKVGKGAKKESAVVRTGDVRKLREKYKGRDTAWTIEELEHN
ncbi:glucose/arabinose dehydrogenase [Dyadobacter jejuensis]|uniref:Glucose/arabinose dehydrogenase n=1 Tax=Dyadobacter jejuensis TaxID=1082580 RepID=A0A316A8F6_9BACT|nr:c-type cytochrome [Dyadobacter jejuensis]PWJ53729.1 glucose/arabinose dehydrogenase [Dyadobacter jejuensis]